MIRNYETLKLGNYICYGVPILRRQISKILAGQW